VAKLTIMPGARLHDWAPEHPERTAYRHHTGMDFDITVRVWPNKESLDTTIRMQEQGPSKPTQWRRWPERKSN
jgi:hypothetical protein